MKKNSIRTLFLTAAVCVATASPILAQDEAKTEKKGDTAKPKFVSLFDGKSLDGWKANEENPKAFSIVDGAIKVSGKRGHLFYSGDVDGGKFKNFVLRAKVMTKEKANSGLYFHTVYQKDGWPEKGYEVQVNNTHSDWRKTGSLYGVDDVKESQKDDEWMDYVIRVKGNRVVIKINGKKVVDFKQAEKPEHVKDYKGRLIGEGTFAIQAHDPRSVAFFKDIKVRVLK